jgi:hypothetical protein
MVERIKRLKKHKILLMKFVEIIIIASIVGLIIFAFSLNVN